MLKPIPNDEVSIWFNVQNMHFERIELFRDVFLSLYYLIESTYLGQDTGDTKVTLTTEDIELHFEWCWNKVISNFKLESIHIKEEGKHKEYVKSFFMDIFYFSNKSQIQTEIDDFLGSIFNYRKNFTKSDLEILTEIYHLLNKNIN